MCKNICLRPYLQGPIDVLMEKEMIILILISCPVTILFGLDGQALKKGVNL